MREFEIHGFAIRLDYDIQKLWFFNLNLFLIKMVQLCAVIKCDKTRLVPELNGSWLKIVYWTLINERPVLLRLTYEILHSFIVQTNGYSKKLTLMKWNTNRVRSLLISYFQFFAKFEALKIRNIQMSIMTSWNQKSAII